jgi:hypothetical protein
MRLINLDTLQLEEFIDSSVPPFAILSHTWGTGEVTFQHVTTFPREDLASCPGWIKITGFCTAVKAHMEDLTGETVQYGWVDTCCIDKTSSAELSEAINSMFRWYRNAVACFAFLADDKGADDFERSRWFTRGWTLQELLAPHRLFFFDSGWDFIGDKLEWAQRIASITAIGAEVITSGGWETCCVAEKMSWAARRTTTRAEDMAYCLLGLFDVNMPLLYGEGGEKAFIRLQEEILKESEDQSIFAWDATATSDGIVQIGALATSPAQFRSGGSIEAVSQLENQVVLTAKGVQAHLPIVRLPNDSDEVALLACRYKMDINSLVGIPVKLEPGGVSSAPSCGPTIYTVSTSSGGMQVYSRLPKPAAPVTVSPRVPRQLSLKICLVKRHQLRVASARRGSRCWLLYDQVPFKPTKSRRHLLGWRISDAQSMTSVLPRERKNMILPFVSHHESEDRPCFFVIVSVWPAAIGRDGADQVLVGLAGGRGGSSVKDLEAEMSGLDKRENGVVMGQQASIVVPGRGSTKVKVRATVTVMDEGTIFRIILSRA